MTWLWGLLALSGVAHANPDDPFLAWRDQSVRRGAVISYDAVRHQLVVSTGGDLLELRTERAEIVGRLQPGAAVDVAYESAGYYARRIEVRRGRPRPAR